MIKYSPISVLWVDGGSGDTPPMLLSYLGTISHLQVDEKPQLPQDLSEWDVVVTVGQRLADPAIDRLTAFVHGGGGWLTFIGPDTRKIPALFGVQPEPAGPFCELRVLFDTGDHPLSVRLPDAIYVNEHCHPLAVKADDAESILYADWQFKHIPVLVERPHGDGATACTTLWDVRHPVLCQIL